MSLAPYVHVDRRLTGANAGDRVPLTSDVAHHLTRVLRLRAGTEVVVADGVGGEATGRLAADTVVLAAAPVHTVAARPILTVAQALPKARKLDEVIRQATELGVDRIAPVAAGRSVTRLDGERGDRAVGRWTAIARAASEQARRPHRPVVAPIVTAEDLATSLPTGELLLVAHVGASRALTAAVAAAGERPGVTIAIGPEGGWTEHEIATFVAAGGEVVGLGASVLRTEHAAAAALAALAALTGRWE